MQKYKPKKKITSQQKKSKLKRKLDRIIQEKGREVYDRCMVCGSEYSCLHHYYTKSMSLRLRYDWENLIPLCAGCHFSHHNGNPEIHNKVRDIKGEDWLKELEAKKRQIANDTIEYYEDLLTKFNRVV